MKRVTLVVLGLAVSGAALAPGARAQGGRMLNVGSTTVVLAHGGGRDQGEPLPRAVSAPRFRPLTAETRAALLRRGAETLAVAAPGAALNQLVEMPGGIALLTSRLERVVPPVPELGTAAPGFRPLSAQTKTEIEKAAAGAEGEGTAAPARPPAEQPFTLTPMSMRVPGRGFLYMSEPYFINGSLTFAAFTAGKGFVRLMNDGSSTRSYMLHFQLLNAEGKAYEYSIYTADNTTTRVTAKPSGVQDVVILLTLPGTSIPGRLAEVRGGGPTWYFLGVEVTPQ